MTLLAFQVKKVYNIQEQKTKDAHKHEKTQRL